MAAERPSPLSEEAQASLALVLHQEELFGIATRPEDFIKLKSERLSPHYFNIRDGISSYATRTFIARTMIDLAQIPTDPAELQDQSYHVAGTPEAMTSFATTIADLTQASLLQPRANLTKTTGNKAPILGRYSRGDWVDAFDDVITDGQSKVETIEALQQEGLMLCDYYVVLDREEGGRAQVKEATNFDVTPAIGVSSLVLFLREDGFITQAQFDSVRAYMAQYGDDHARERLSV